MENALQYNFHLLKFTYKREIKKEKKNQKTEQTLFFPCISICESAIPSKLN